MNTVMIQCTVNEPVNIFFSTLEFKTVNMRIQVPHQIQNRGNNVFKFNFLFQKNEILWLKY